ncbi:hypothetical protein FNU76_06415 [Chitinimonas arctica]|uniref:Periplasmic chaperone PpiD n=1 Tax=Chitinimonas arctica TaxID=2594795 RepID=A0A516SCZ4_9NEIS|nr:peptidylprolyl isomerase [Chitinimonas arctica]QDQ26014.1 hypothetical protein FNU76_06415 [Chitinimonas arctica]
MFEFVQNNRRAVGVALGLVVLGLMVGGGMATYEPNGQATYVAKVGDVEITERDLAMANGGQAVAETARPQLLQDLIQQQLLANEGKKLNVGVSEDQLRAEIQKVEAFKGEDGRFSLERYKQFLSQRQMTPAQLESRLTDDLRTRRLAGALSLSSIHSQQTGERLLQALTEAREVTPLLFSPDRFLAQATVTPAEIKQYYDGHQAEFRMPERVKLAYLVLSREELARSVELEPAAIQAYYDKNQRDLAAEERQVRHILIKADPKASKEVRTAARQKIDQLLAQVKQEPARFAELAKQNSEDTGSAVQGGDLGYFPRGAMVKAFDAAAFKLAKGELSGVVETEFGYHILQVENIRTKTLEELKPVIEQRLRQEAAQKRFAAEAEKFSDMVYQQGDSLQGAATAFKLTVRESDWLTREASADPMLNQAKLREAVFGDDVLKKKHNSEAVEVAPGTLVSARILAHEAARQLPLADVTAKIGEQLKRERAVKLAQAEGKKALAALQAGNTAGYEWAATAVVSRMRPEGLEKPAVDAIFGLPGAKLPAYTGVEGKDNYVLFRVGKAAQQALPPEMVKNMPQTLQKLAGEEALVAYLAQLRKQQNVQMR